MEVHICDVCKKELKAKNKDDFYYTVSAFPAHRFENGLFEDLPLDVFELCSTECLEKFSKIMNGNH